MKTTILLLLFAIILAACSAPQMSPKIVVLTEGPSVDSIKMYVDSYVAGNWTSMRSLFQDTAAIYHNGSEKMSADSIISYHTYRRQLYDKVEMNIVHAQQTTYENGDKWRNAWVDLNLTLKGSGELVRVPAHFAWRMAGNKVGLEMAYYDKLAIFQAVTRANEAAAAAKK